MAVCVCTVRVILIHIVEASAAADAAAVAAATLAVMEALKGKPSPRILVIVLRNDMLGKNRREVG